MKKLILTINRGMVLACSTIVLLMIPFSVAASKDFDDTENLLFDDIPSVFSASKYEQKVTEAPARINIITAKEIESYGYQTLADILRSVPGFYSTYDRNYNYTGVRGIGIPGDYDTRILTLIDGHRINENLFDSSGSDRIFVIDVDLIERVEIVRGPASSLYGSSAFFGVINIITKNGRDFQGTEVSVAGDSNDSYQGRISHGEKYDNGLEMLLSATLYDAKGDELFYPEFDDPATNNGITTDTDYERVPSLFARMNHGGFTLTAVYSEQEKGIPTASYGTVFNDPETKTVETRGYLDLKYQGLLDSGADITGRLFYDYYEYEGTFIYDYSDAGDLSDLQPFTESARGDWWGGEIYLSRSLFDDHHFTLGAEYRNSIKEEQDSFDAFDVYLRSRTDSYTLGIFLQDEYRIKDNLILNVGIRYDDFEHVGSTTNPRAALIWTPLADSTIKILYGSAFRAPNAYELYFNDGDFAQKAPDSLKSETIDTYELIFEQRLSHQLNLTASLYRNEIEELITLDTDPADDLLVFVNQGDATAEGFELELFANWMDGWSGSVSYTYQNAEDDNGEWLVNSPKNMAKFNAMKELLGRELSAGLEIQYQSERKTITDERADSFVVTNLTLLNQETIEGLQASLSVYNLFDKTYSNPGSEEHEQDQIEQDGRTFWLKLDYMF